MSVNTGRSNEPIPGYRLCERIGAGGYGEVWRCEAPGELVKAIKLVYGRLDDDRAARELKALQRVKAMRHPFLLSLERIEVVDGQLMIVTELAEGSLKDCFDRYRAKKQPGIPIEELLGYLRDAADALDYMSEKHSLQHLDVKPENLLIVGDHVKVADFGLVKEIQEVTASIMGGLTPLYAPPEVFDGQPTRLSDQYSLAIVFQEMLTAVLPFPGKTAAQLAAQHLNAKPRLSALPTIYQPIIARALSKKPTDRYNSCRELVKALGDARQQEQYDSGEMTNPYPPRNAPVNQQQTPAPTNFAAETYRIDPDAPAPESTPTSDGNSFRTPDAMIDDLNHATATASWLIENDSASNEPTFAAETRPLNDVAPVDFDVAKWSAHPTIFIGIGGAGRQAVAGLKQRWKDHFGTSGPAMRLLSVDLEMRGMSNSAANLEAHETLEIPLRKAQDYRRDGGKLSSWLSRRWLFNIPRSQMTDGIRPLGRLAFVDHCERIKEAVHQAVTEVLSQDREAAPSDSKGIVNMPRVVLVGAIGGGTGSGAIIDLAYLVRQCLEQLNCHSSELLLVMAHGTSRNPSTQEIAAASAFATLTELGHFLKPGLGYPGDGSCGIKPRQAQQGLLDGAYLIHLGEEMSPARYKRALSKLSEFLFLESATPVGGYLSAVRRHDDPVQDTLGRRLAVRSIGLCQLGFAQDSLVTQLAENVCRETINRWIGTPRPDATQKPKPHLLQPTRSTTPPGAQIDAQIDELTRQLIVSFQLDEQHFIALADEMVAQEVQNKEQFLQSLTAEHDPHAQPGHPSLPPLLRVNRVCGDRDERGDLPESAHAPLRQALTDRVRQVARPLGERIRHALEQLIENPQFRLYGASRAVRTVQSHLRSWADQVRESRKQLNHEIHSLESWMCPSADPRQRKRNPADEVAYRRLYCEKRLEDAAAAAVQQLIGALQSYVGQSNDLLVDLDRELRGWQDEFQLMEAEVAPSEKEASEDTENDSSDLESSPLDPVRQVILHELQQRVATLAKAIDQRVTADVFAQQGGMRGVLLKGGLLRQQLASTVRAHARRGILHLLRTIDIQRLLVEGLPGQQVANNLFGEALRTAEPWLQSLGGNRRLLCICPQEHAAKWPADKMSKLANLHGFANTPAVISQCGSEAVLLYELGDLSLRRVATALIDSRPDLAELARRLHTRTDVAWQPLPT